MKGGRRQGSGRKITGRTSKVVRVSNDLLPYLDRLEDVITAIDNWNQYIKEQKGPRWEKAKEMGEDLNTILRGEY